MFKEKNSWYINSKACKIMKKIFSENLKFCNKSKSKVIQKKKS